MNPAGAILKPVRHLTWTPLILAALLPSCVIYDQALIDEAAQDSVQSGGGFTLPPGGTGGTGGQIGSGGTGGEPGTGGAPVTPSGGSSTGGAPGGGTGGEPASGGTGGSDVCEGEVGEFTDVDLDTLELIDDFNINLPPLSNDMPGSAGSWSTQAEAAALPSLNPKAKDSLSWAADSTGYESYSCDENNLAMHIQASDTTVWGVSFTGKLLESGKDVDLSAYAGVVFWAKSSNLTSLEIAWTNEANEDDEVGSGKETLGANWKQYKAPFPADMPADPDRDEYPHAFSSSALSIVKLLGRPGAGSKVDLWIEDLTLYSEPAAN